MATTVTTSEVADSTEFGKPVKLRSACNACFAAKVCWNAQRQRSVGPGLIRKQVRCDGNKSGCRRCVEKGLDCIYSESRVGKVVGRRRKRPMSGSGNGNGDSTYGTPSMAPACIPSPASTGSDGSSKRHCADADWSTFTAFDEQYNLTMDNCDERLLDFETLQPVTSMSLATAVDVNFLTGSGLPTPTPTPSMDAFFSSSEQDTRPSSRQASVIPEQARFRQPACPASLGKSTENSVEDEEIACLKLLAQLKKHGVNNTVNAEAHFALAQKANASLRRLTKSKRLRSDYSCQLLLSSILGHLVKMCEWICQSRPFVGSTVSEQGVSAQRPLMGSRMGDGLDHGCLSGDPSSLRAALKTTIRETTVLCSAAGDMLKRKPLNGFQTLGRHECFHVDLEQRLRRVLASLP